MNEHDVLIIGGGLAGLWAATRLAGRGLRVRVLERRSVLGGRATSDGPPGFRMNLGPHALYRRSFARPLLESVGVRIDGAIPPLGGNLASYGDRIEPLPSGWLSFATSGLLDGGARWSFLAGMARAMRAHPDHGSIGEWLAEHVRHEVARALIGALVRVTTYSGDGLAAGPALDQLRRGLRGNVLYLHGGWGGLVEQLRDRAIEAGAEISAGVTARAIQGRAVLTSDGPIEARAILACVPPDALAHLAPEHQALADGVAPVRAAVLDVALDALPRPDQKFLLGIDRPLYFSVHSETARIAPAGGAIVHVARYGGEGPEGPAELEGLLDRLQPGWRSHLIERRYMPRLTVAYDLPRSGRAPAGVRAGDGLWIAGDWVGERGMLTDRALASAEEATDAIIAELHGAEADAPRRRVS